MRKVKSGRVVCGNICLSKTKLSREWYLREDRVWVRRWVKLRAGVEDLEVERGRARGIEREARTCKFCCAGVVEDEEHCLDQCEHWAEERRDMWRRVREMDERGWSRASSMTVRQRTDWLLQGRVGGKKMRRNIMKAVVRILFRRDREVIKRGMGYVTKKANGRAVRISRLRSIKEVKQAAAAAATKAAYQRLAAMDAADAAAAAALEAGV